MVLAMFVFLALGIGLMYAALHSGMTWQKPWQPFVDALSSRPGAAAS